MPAPLLVSWPNAAPEPFLHTMEDTKKEWHTRPQKRACGCAFKHTFRVGVRGRGIFGYNCPLLNLIYSDVDCGSALTCDTAG